jgi:hypothetical protein
MSAIQGSSLPRAFAVMSATMVCAHKPTQSLLLSRLLRECPAFGHLIVFFLCHLAIHDEERSLAISKVRLLLILYRAEGVT